MVVSINTAALASLLGLFLTAGGVLVWMFNVRARFLALEKHDKRDHEMIQQLVKGQFATLDGLKQMGCNGHVTEAWEELQKQVIEH